MYILTPLFILSPQNSDMPSTGVKRSHGQMERGSLPGLGDKRGVRDVEEEEEETVSPSKKAKVAVNNIEEEKTTNKKRTSEEDDRPSKKPRLNQDSSMVSHLFILS